MGAPERPAQQLGIEPVSHTSLAAAAVFCQCESMARAATRAGAVMHHAVIRQRHAGRAKAKAIVHL